MIKRQQVQQIKDKVTVRKGAVGKIGQPAAVELRMKLDQPPFTLDD